MQQFYNVCGYDIGSWTTKICALMQNNTFQILTNQANFRETPSLVAFSQAERLIGQQALIKIKSNFANTLRSPTRCIGLGKKVHIIDQQLRTCYIPYRNINNQLQFQIKTKNEQKIVKPEQFLIALFTKIKGTCENHKISPLFSYIATPSFFNNGERKALKACAQAANLHNITLIDDWQALSVQYGYSKYAQLKKQGFPKVILFIDFGYGKFAVHACQISHSEVKLIDQQVLRYTGSKNMDNFMIDFYSQMLKQQTGVNLKQNKKAMVKIGQNVEAQRKKLSANTQNQINIECIFGDEDLCFNLTRQKLQMIVMPILSQLSSALQALKSRLDPIAKIDAIELVGGTSRMPFFQQIVSNIYGIAPTKQLNASEGLVRGATIAGCLRTGIVDRKGLQVKKTSQSKIILGINYLDGSIKQCGMHHQNYKTENKYLIFDKDQAIPCQKTIKMKKNCLIQAYLFSMENMHAHTIGYFQYQSQSITIGLSLQRIFHFNLHQEKKDSFKVYQMDDIISEQILEQLKKEQMIMVKRDQEILKSYEMKNEYESLLYNTKEQIKKDWKQYASPAEIQISLSIIGQCQEWLDMAKNPSIQEINERRETILMLTNERKKRKQYHRKISYLFKVFLNQVMLIETKSKGKNELLERIKVVKDSITQKYQAEEGNFWSGQYLKDQTLEQARQQIRKYKN